MNCSGYQSTRQYPSTASLEPVSSWIYKRIAKADPRFVFLTHFWFQSHQSNCSAFENVSIATKQDFIVYFLPRPLVQQVYEVFYFANYRASKSKTCMFVSTDWTNLLTTSTKFLVLIIPSTPKCTASTTLLASCNRRELTLYVIQTFFIKTFYLSTIYGLSDI